MMRFPLAMSAALAAHIARRRLARKRFIPLVLMLEPLFACNLTCSTCGRIREYAGRAGEMMRLEDCLEAARECSAPVVSICGGEPLIYPAIAQLVSGLVRMGRYIYLCTNGVILARCIDRFQPSKRLFINVHIDGPAEVHDRIVERPGAYEAAVDGVKAAVARGFAVTVNTTVCRETNLAQIDSMMTGLAALGVRTFMLSPAYSYEAVHDKSAFMSRAEVQRKFREAEGLDSRHRLADTPVYLEFLRGERDLDCTAWGNPTRNPAGWRSPCYLIADRHFPTYDDLIELTDWNAYGPGRDPRCADCMVHCGFEPTAALMRSPRRGDLWKMLRWQLG